MTMTTQKTELNLEQLPYGYEAGLVSKLIAVPGKIVRSIGKFFDTLGEAIELRNRYVALDSLNDATLKSLGLTRANISQVVALEAGLIDAPATPVADNSNVRSIRPAA
jgi:uncharacterized protein YjiS (DUF1127 family)